MPRNKKPASRLELVGAFKRHPERRREGPHLPDDEIGPKLPGFTPGQAAAWDFIVETAPPGLLKRMDAAYLALVSMALDNVLNYDPDKHGGKPLSAAAVANVGRMLQRLGMTPIDRHGVEILPPKKSSVFDQFTKAGRVDDDDDDFKDL